MMNKKIMYKKNKFYSSVHRRQSLLVFLSFVLLLVVISGCTSKISSQPMTSNNEEPTQIVNKNTEQIEIELEDPSLEELDNVDLSNW